MCSHTVSNGSIWLHAIYVICLFIVVVCGLIYSQICFHLYGFIWFPAVKDCGLEMHVVTNSFKWTHMVACHIVVVCGSIGFHKVVYSQIWFYLLPTVVYCIVSHC